MQAGKAVTTVELWVAPDASSSELREALCLALSSKLRYVLLSRAYDVHAPDTTLCRRRLPLDTPFKLLRADVPCALSAGALLCDAASLTLDAGPPPPQPSWFKQHAPELTFLLCLFALFANVGDVVICIAPMSLAAAAVSPGGAGAGALLSRAAPTAGLFLTAFAFAAADEALLSPVLSGAGFALAFIAALWRSRIVALSSTLLVAKALVSRGTATEARWRKANGGSGAGGKQR